MNDLIGSELNRRSILRGGAAGALILAMPACSTIPGLSFTDAIRRLLLLSSERAFTRLTADGGYWDSQVGRLGLNQLLGVRGDTITSVLTSTLFKSRLEGVFADIAVEGSERAAPIVAEAVRTIGISNAIALVQGGPTAATNLLRGELGGTLVEAMVPEIGDAIQIASDPLVARLVNSATGTDIGEITQRLSNSVNGAIWEEIGTEESAIRQDPGATNDPLLIGVFGVGSAL
ncbi:MAG: DUF4197 domain-containing protein [Erythrobacter sp.]